jgi:branched-chain amino acid transport system permease protein
MIRYLATGRLAGGRLGAAPAGLRWLLLGAGLLVALGLPWFVYPPVALDIASWALFAVALDLLLGYTGLLSFGHAAFWGSSAYATGLIAVHSGLPFPVAVLGGAVVAMALAVPIGYLSVRRSGIYFAMVTLAFAQLLFFAANQWRGLTGGENGLQGVPRTLAGLDLTDPFYFYYAGLPIVAFGLFVAWRAVRSPFGRVLVAIRENPARVRALGYPVSRYQLGAFVLSAGLAGLAGGLYAVGHGFVSLQEVYWTTSGKVVIMTVLGGIGTLWGSVVGAALIVELEDYLATAGFDGIGIVTGAIFVLVVLLFRRGIVGTLLAGWERLSRPVAAEPGAGGAPAAPPDSVPARSSPARSAG